jgi:hypothetical protein
MFASEAEIKRERDVKRQVRRDRRQVAMMKAEKAAQEVERALKLDADACMDEILDSLAPDTLMQDDAVKLADVVTIDPSVMEGVDLKNTRALTEWVLDRYMPKNEKGVREGLEVLIADDGTIQKFTAQGITSSTKKRNPRKGGDAQRQTYAGLDGLIKSAVFSHFEEADVKHPGIKGQNVYHVPARFGNQIYSVRIKIDIPTQKELMPSFKDVKIEREIPPILSSGQTLENQHGTTQAGVISKVNVEVLRGIVNPTAIPYRHRAGRRGRVYALAGRMARNAARYSGRPNHAENRHRRGGASLRLWDLLGREKGGCRGVCKKTCTTER